MIDDKKRNDSLTELWNDKNFLAFEIENLLKPFCKKFDLTRDQVQIESNYAGVSVKVLY